MYNTDSRAIVKKQHLQEILEYDSLINLRPGSACIKNILNSHLINNSLCSEWLCLQGKLWKQHILKYTLSMTKSLETQETTAQNFHLI